MALLGTAALAMWWSVAPEAREEFGHWHSHEHFPERLALPGFRRASRWVEADGGPGVFVMYELDDHAVLSSPAYLARLNAPTPWSTRMMPLHQGMVRCQCRVLRSEGGAVAGYAATFRWAGAQGPGDATRSGDALKALAGRPGLTGVHWLRHQAPAIAPTAEQRIRGTDAAADHVLVVTGYERSAVEAVLQQACADAALAGLVAGAAVRGLYRLAQSSVPGELRGLAG